MIDLIESPRLVMRPVKEDEAEALREVFRDPAVRRYLLDDSLVPLEWVRDEIASSRERFATLGAGLWGIRLVDTTALMGFVGFRHFFEPPRLQLLYGLLPAHWGRGLAVEAAGRICDHAFRVLGFRRVEAAMDAPNAPSLKVAERLGMTRMASPDPQLDGTLFYEIDRERWLRTADAQPDSPGSDD